MRTPLSITLAVLLLSASYTLAEPPVIAREQLNAVLWIQTAAEYQGAARQAYRLAQRRLPELKASKATASVEQEAAGGFAQKKPAVVLNIDETVLDNTAYNAGLVQQGRVFTPQTWHAWVLAEEAKSVRGAPEFIRRARELGYRVVYITNRNCNDQGAYDAQGRSQDCPQQAATIANLEKELGYRPADADVLMRFEIKGRDDSDKKARRMEVANSNRIAMLVGDDLNDFIRRADYVDGRDRGKWAERWFVVPNPVYGSWQTPFPDLNAKYAGLTVWTPQSPEGKSLALVSWNLEWLADPDILDSSGFWTTCKARGWPNEKLREDLPFCDVYKRDGILSASDYAEKKLKPLRQALAAAAARNVDILAVQEVQGPSALAAVLPPGYRVACFTSRVDAQNVGYAVRVGSDFGIECHEITALSLENDPNVERPVRRGLELDIAANGTSLGLLNVHLKSACPKGRMDGSNQACRTLQRQAAPLEGWIEDQANAGRAFLIIGDWNRDLEDEVRGNFPARSDGSDPTGPINPATVRNLFPEINDHLPASTAMELAKVDRSAAAGNACHDILDQLVLSDSLQAMLDPASLEGGRLPARLVRGPAGASDHCALEVAIRFK